MKGWEGGKGRKEHTGREGTRKIGEGGGKQVKKGVVAEEETEREKENSDLVFEIAGTWGED